MLRRDDRLDDVGDIVYIRQGLYAEEDVVEWLFRRMRSVFWCSNNCEAVSKTLNLVRVHPGVPE